MDIYEVVTNFYESVNAEKRIIGKSVFGRNLYAVKAGEGTPVGIAQYAIHGREFITAKLAIEHFHVGVEKGSVWILPLMNPDGALLCQKSVLSVPQDKREELLSLNENKDDFSLWKANGRGVDLNVNFAAAWGKGVKNVKTPCAENCIGAFPFSEPETLALKIFSEEIRPQYTLSYHTKGEEIYWYFYQSIRTCPRDKYLASVLSDSTGYPLSQAKGSVGGYKDWCIEKLKIPAFTIEAGQDGFSHPLGEEAFDDLLKKNKRALYDLSAAF